MSRLALILALLVLLTACNSGSNEPTLQTGTYTFQTSSPGDIEWSGQITISEKEIIDGTGTATATSDNIEIRTVSLDVGGVYEHPEVRMNWDTGDGVWLVDTSVNTDGRLRSGTLDLRNGATFTIFFNR